MRHGKQIVKMFAALMAALLLSVHVMPAGLSQVYAMTAGEGAGETAGGVAGKGAGEAAGEVAGKGDEETAGEAAEEAAGKTFGEAGLPRDLSLTISYRDDGVPLAGAAFSLYQVAVLEENGGLTMTEEFALFGVAIPEEADAAWKTLASTLEGYVLRDNLTPDDSGVTDEEGLLSFPAGEKKPVPGLYLLLGSRHRQNGLVYDAQPSVVLLPSWERETGTWNDQVTISPKYESAPGEDTVTRKVLKVWKDEGYENERPGEITVQLLRDGTVYDEVTLNADNNWRYVWEELDGRCRWTLTETEPEGYTVEIIREGITFVVTNTRKEPDNPPTDPAEPTEATTEPAPPDKPALPLTGQLWWPVPLLACMGLLCIAGGLIRRRRDFR